MEISGAREISPSRRHGRTRFLAETRWHGFRPNHRAEGPMAAIIRRILVPTDFSPASDHAISYATSLARTFGAPLYLVHVVQDDRQYQDARQVVNRIAATRTLGAPRVIGEVRVGDPATSIAEAAQRYGADLIVMATRGRTGLSHAISGSVAEAVIRTARCPVLVLRDSGKVRVHVVTGERSGTFAGAA
jgi:nucleotide-binding universal stress UspA family protein